MENDYRQLILALVESKVQFIIVGGIAAVVHGSARATFDLDIVYLRNEHNVQNLIKALKPHNPYLRDTPPGLPFSFDEPTVKNGFELHVDHRSWKSGFAR